MSTVLESAELQDHKTQSGSTDTTAARRRQRSAVSRFWGNLPISRKAAMAVMLPVTALLIGFVLLYFLSRAGDRAQREVDEAMRVRYHLRGITTAVLAADSSITRYLVSGDQRFLAAFANAQESVAASLDHVAPLLTGDRPQEQHARLAKARQLIDRDFELKVRLREIRSPTDTYADPSVTELLTASGEASEEFRATVNEMEAEERQLQRERVARLHAFRELSVAAGAATVILGLLGAIGGVWLLSKSIVRRVHRISENADRLARELPLTYFTGGSDEISELARRLEYTSGLLAARSVALREEAARLQANIARREKAEKEKGESEMRLQAILDHTSAVVYVKDLESRMLMVNRQFETLFGLSRHEARGHTMQDLFGSRVGKPLMDHDAEVIRRGIPLEFEEVVPQADGEHTYLSMKFPLLDRSGQPYAICGISSDITARKASDRALRAANQELDARVTARTAELEATNAQLLQEVAQHRETAERLQSTQQQFLHAQKMEALGLLAGGVAHDFNNILTAIMGYATVMIEELPEAEREQSHAAEILRASERAASLSKQLLAFSRRQPYRPTILDLSALVTELEKMLQQVLGDRVTLVTSLAADLPSVNADAGQIEQLLLNLVVNARDAMPGDGTIKISTSAVTLRPDEIKITADTQRFVALCVSDTGTGISPDVQARMFEPFFTTKHPGQGTGLGLASCNAIAQQSGGWLACESTVGKGAEFIMYLPQVHGTAAPRRNSHQGEIPGGTETILVVEDEPVVGGIVALLLRSLGYNVITAEDGAEAEHVVQDRGDGGIDLVLTDLHMPRMNGRELMERLAVANPTVKVLLTSGNDELLNEESAAEVQIDFLPKPFTLHALARKVRSVLDNGAPREHS